MNLPSESLETTKIPIARASLLIVQGADQGTRFELGDVPITIGRSLHNPVRLLDTEVSRTHAAIERDGDKFVLKDRNSSNGTFVNGAQIKSRTLKPGDQIQIGRTILQFLQGDHVGSRRAADRVELLHQADGTDRSSIVGQMALTGGLPLKDLPAAVSNNADARLQATMNLQMLYRISEEAVRPSSSMTQILQRMLDLAIETLGADRGCVLLRDAETEALQAVAVGFRGQESAVQDDSSTPGASFKEGASTKEGSPAKDTGEKTTGRIPVSRTIVDYVVKSLQAVRTSDARHDSRFETGQSIVRAGIREAMCVPLQARHELMGVVYLDITSSAEEMILLGDQPRFSEEQLRVLAAIGRQAALAVENQRFQEAFVKSERLAAMGQTIATLSHHIKNILQGVRGGSYLIDLGLGKTDTELIRKGWGIVDKNQSKIYNLVMDMLTFSKERQPEMKLSQLNDVAQDVVELMQPQAGEVETKLLFHPATQLPTSTFDPEGIHRAILNVVSNAMDAVEHADDPRVVVQTGFDEPRDLLWVSVEDNGTGIAPENLSKMFLMFESTKGARGTGLGLAVSQKIIREHGGDITVESQIGKGSRFVLTWPRLEDETQMPGMRTLVDG
ncbi:ATP-binding protein [Planctopirus hydrillae]|uniref:ATP-binding protein n=1 Tax=Planctopirus hydrillae TaxID=1841610 RepID=UPI001F0A9878|nr:ATP-binding protein [Planctopirus hydrillae]